mmetsp:Transcript_38084/g.77033  ORF Transcript_38084/g.77033 Transcript_38084/m.77033 type:complete len:213 (-) Transcript_38084:382-1020(-)
MPWNISGYRFPAKTGASFGPTLRRRSGDRVRARWAADTLVSRFATLVVPGIGKTSSPCLCSHARERVAGVTPSLPASSSRGASSFTFCSRFSPCRYGVRVWNLGPAPSELPILSQSSCFFTSPLVKPRHSGEYATTAMPRSRHSGTRSASRLRTTSDHSCWMAVRGWMLCATRISSGVASDSPRYLIFPSSTSFLQAVIQLLSASMPGTRCK